jgi:hypothetical protein
MKKAERHAEILRRAKELAKTGNYGSWLDVEMALRREGLAEARGLLDSRIERHSLDVICEHATGKPAWGSQSTDRFVP